MSQDRRILKGFQSRQLNFTQSFSNLLRLYLNTYASNPGGDLNNEPLNKTQNLFGSKVLFGSSMLRIKLNFAVENCFALNCTLRSFVLFSQIKEMHWEFKTVFISMSKLLQKSIDYPHLIQVNGYPVHNLSIQLHQLRRVSIYLTELIKLVKYIFSLPKLGEGRNLDS